MGRVSRRWLFVMAACAAAVCLSAEPDVPHIGRWKLNPAKSDVGGLKAASVSQGEDIIEFVRRGGGVTLILRATSATCEASFDGSDYPLIGPTMPKGATLSLMQSARSISLVQKQNGDVIAYGLLTVSPDGNTLVELVLPSDGAKPTRATKVYDRQ